ncbi:valine--tRNA ligase 1 [Anaeramoeba ignava]|uniref:Valine--tRNA ligase, mitochondrial n=1 Tax=Anaeramoeba ignava TaxID=1746090 RepID=A0A9Q0LST1_ANAIG|nr:valine--tRNA ligase 1 [Anaeramoeba ignava]|eukprot:Anaeramoba_ignava/a347255_474.p1 GENE.a347255_474~~a347255_474.p1  ORF type:complete len:1007 (+),score=338.19 a347255_474:49-3069(+)
MSTEKKNKKKESGIQKVIFINKTPTGEKKDLSHPIEKSYEPPVVEAAWYDWWEKKGFFKPSNSEKKFVIVIPPPNVTGSLHLGHALTNSIQDTLVRWHRLKGESVLWVPGTDHAGIATQVVVEKKIMREQKKTKYDLGREKFVEEVWKWKEEFGNKIFIQLRKLGSSLDWTKEVFTMDEIRTKSVNEAFVRMFDEGIIYRSDRLVNWSCALRTAISDIEVEYITLEKKTMMNVPGHGNKKYPFGILTEFAYPLDLSDEDQKNTSLKEIVVATTRIETMLGDTAVAVHPDDPRYKDLHGKFVIHPFNSRKIPIITDAKAVDMSFGTGAVKITPGHDPNDFETGIRNSLQLINIFNEDGTINKEGGKFEGMKRFDARIAIYEELKQKGLIRGEKPNPMRIGICSRSGDIIEPILKPQWFVNCNKMAEESIEVVKTGKLKIIPDIFEDTWFRWLENIRDWCISRQLWWGHRIPAYFVDLPNHNRDKTEHWIAARTEEEAREKAGKKFNIEKTEEIKLYQDEDVLDTWFSSGLFPFSVFGWPEETQDLKTFFPTTLLETGHDILFFWVARMVMMSLNLTKQLPFSYVYLHPIIRDAHGRKMSKSLGNVVDPNDVISGITLKELNDKLLQGNLNPNEVNLAKKGQAKEFPKGIAQCGADALRFGLCAYTIQGRDVNLDINRIVGYRMFCNKIWNAVKFTLNFLGDSFELNPESMQNPFQKGESMIDLWILSRLNEAIIKTNESFEEYKLSKVTDFLYSFWLNELCGVYLELLKPIKDLDSNIPENEVKKNAAKYTLYRCVETGLRLLHPVMPFLTEELWQRLPKLKDDPESIMISRYPEPIDAWRNEEAEKTVDYLLKIIHACRSTRQNYLLTNERPNCFLKIHNDFPFQLLDSHLSIIATLGQVGQILIVSSDSPQNLSGFTLYVVDQSCSVHLNLKGIVDFEKEILKMKKKREGIQSRMQKFIEKTQIPNYSEKVPKEIQDLNSEKIDSLSKQLEQIDSQIEEMERMKF